ncbi:recombinase family protein [Phenylobacterium sp.]|uniref:recombinase family protein n=1 Tax=Phenylobacterium sp. TaxID=1871053 RepID=UPI0026046EB5|nr:recombinase family protein [Phenylobacterium sp.]
MNPDEALRVTAVFERYLALGSIHALERSGVHGKSWVNRASNIVGGGNLSRGALHYLLTNPAYRGITRHHDKRYVGTHPAIVDAELWDKVQAKLADAPASQPKSALAGEPAVLQRRLFDDRGNAMVVVHTNRRGRRYRYYVSRPKLTGKGEAGSLHRISAGLVEQFLVDRLTPLLAEGWRPDDLEVDRVAEALIAVTLSADRIVVDLQRQALRSDVAVAEIDDQPGLGRFDVAFHMRRRQGALVLDAAGGQPAAAGKIDRALVRAIALARVWAQQLESGEIGSITAPATREKLCSHYTARLLPLAYLAPDLVDQVVQGRQPRSLTLAALTQQTLPIYWEEQRRVFGDL